MTCNDNKGELNMNEGKAGFHGNMVIWNKNNICNGFGFFGQSGHGKTPLSFALVQKFIDEEKIKSIKLFDDSFELEEGKIYRYNGWGSSDLLGFRDELESIMNKKRMHINNLFSDQNEKFLLDNVTVWLLLFHGEENSSKLGDTEPYKKEKCTYEKFVPILIKTNPLWNVQGDKEKFIRERLKNSWDYYKITIKSNIDERLRDKMKKIKEKRKRNEKITDEENVTYNEKIKIDDEKRLIDYTAKDAYMNL